MQEMNEILFTHYSMLESVEDKTEMMEYLMELDEEFTLFKWNLAKTWMFGSTDDLTDEQQLAAAGLI